MNHTVIFTVQPYDTDFGGVISNTSYIRWIEQLRMGWFDSLVPRSRQEQEHLSLMVARTEINYLVPIGLYENEGHLKGTIFNTEIGRARFAFNIEFYSGENIVVANAIQKTLLIDYAKRAPTRFPEDALARLKQEQLEASPKQSD